MEKYITNLYGHGNASTAMYAQHMVTDIAKDEGYLELAIPTLRASEDSDSELRSQIDGILTPLWPENLVIAQMPSWNGIAFDEVFLERLRQRVDKMVVFVHDFVPLMFDSNYYLMQRYLDAYNKADLIIVPSEQMGQKLVSEGLNIPYIIQELWDHPTSLVQLSRPSFQKKLNFAGDFDRFPFTINWDKDIDLDVFSQPKGPNGIVYSHDYLHVRGFKSDELLLHELNQGGFGLVWSENIENRSEREYSKMNVSFKFSAYLAAGIPIIANELLAKQEFVKKNKIGYIASSLDDAVDYVKNMSEAEYDDLIKNVNNVSWLIKDGFFTKKLLLEVEEFLLLKH
ncbi:beta-1,6-galactofuranosyltransferase [Companilactobacillus sp. RD055328]|uniref:beta-1,6-galactofuranosyltransferase n=1 Tax=Companilactobacillus sp. RD055328 TaxID=2916634 RepID=UPI001FC86037|nr:beta-1,6-galactofuranosyltransferase [Companilactobacillus sp. RD055328]GKQ42758.1 beta-1,6-galactofuranosyltransferase [Companilactobacillus sp. RD055328]